MVRVDRSVEAVASIVLDNPGKLNALDRETSLEELPRVLAELDADVSVRVVVLRGEGGALSSGADLDSDVFEPRSVEAIEADVRKAGRCVVTLRRMSKPSIAVVNGVAVGAGLALACGCDFRFVSANARLGAPFVRIGMSPDFGATFVVPRAFGVQAGLDLLLTGRIMGAEEAVACGFARHISEDPLAEAMQLAEQIGANAPQAVGAARRLVLDGLEQRVEESVLESEAAAVARSLTGPEFTQRFAAYRASLVTRAAR